MRNGFGDGGVPIFAIENTFGVEELISTDDPSRHLSMPVAQGKTISSPRL